ncbi:MAG: sigma-54-dependent Fis family transcriptional regulator [Immundisolibacter sp.]|uniref:sigma-54 dependent transcriptional regulator n=1 Tax=Immundisolibacter sp. TaxID=1934948 RepID=UPI00199E61BA|nr:sigma-54 dependent transcriptional regulator [Immundisolibacter sp.]MBC7162519.1 sigma-54-dependent Fis family transcriptional regulator [Immundisolibacter sp.]
MANAERSVLIVCDRPDGVVKGLIDTLGAGHWKPLLVAEPEAVPATLLAHPECCVGVVTLCAAGYTPDRLYVLCAARTVSWVFLIDPELLEKPEVTRLIAESAYDYHTQPADPRRLAIVLGRAWGMARIRRRNRQDDDSNAEYEMVGSSQPMLELFTQTRKIAAVDAPVLITGESGTGKELTALAIHERSQRGKGPFVAVNCGALPPTLIQAELFGYEKGAFTGAVARQIGRIESAAGGTLLLDEIGDLTPDFQGHLLRFLQQGTIERLGNPRPIPVNVRIISATNVNLEQAVAAGRFRQDLYYRLNVLRVNMPPLRERGEDVVLLAKFFFEKFAPEKRPHVQGYSKKALQALMEHDWPGNVRELINRVRRAMVMSENRLITPDDLGLANINPTASAQPRLHDARTNVERETLATHLLNARGNLSLAARQMGISRVTLYRLMKKHELQPAR